MKSFIITVVVLFLLSAGITLTRKPGPHVSNYTSGSLLFTLIVEVSLAAWGLSLII